MREDKEQEKKDNRNIWIATICFSIIMGFFLVAIITPITLIGWIWDWDIEQQLTKVNNEALQNDLETITFRLTYKEIPETDMRIERAVETYENFFKNPNNSHRIYEGEDGKILELTWYVVDGL